VDITIAEAMLATCSTPPIFTPTIVSKDFAHFEYIGADLGLSNPTREIIGEAHRAFGDETTVSCLLSVGCGHPGVNPAPSDSGGTSWTEFLEGVARDSEKTAQDIGAHMSKLSLYHRLSVDFGLERNQVRELKDPESITAHTITYLNDLGLVDILDRCVNTIKDGDGFTTLEQLSESLIRSPSNFIDAWQQVMVAQGSYHHLYLHWPRTMWNEKCRWNSSKRPYSVKIGGLNPDQRSS